MAPAGATAGRLTPNSRGARAEVRRVQLGEVLPLLGDLILGEDRVDGAGLHARVAVDAFLRGGLETEGRTDERQPA